MFVNNSDDLFVGRFVDLLFIINREQNIREWMVFMQVAWKVGSLSKSL